MSTGCRVHIVISLLAVLVAFPAIAETAGEEPVVRLITVGPGDPLYTWWGHIGLAVDQRFFDYGNFSFDTKNFYTNFAMGRLIYAAIANPTDPYLDYVSRQNRDVTVQTLDIPPHTIREIAAYLESNVLPENKDYLYDHYRDNCATRIRDVLDVATGGALRRAHEGVPSHTFRFHSRIRTSAGPAWDYFIDYLLGPETDRPIDEWDEMFLPSAIAENVARLEYVDDRGVTRRLMKHREERVISSRPPLPDRPRRLWPGALAAGLFAALVSLAVRVFRSTAGRGIAAIWRILMILLTGLPGLLLAFMMTVTDHTVTYGNLSVGPTLPLVLLGLVPAIRAARGKKGAEEKLATAWSANLVGLLVVVFLRLTGIVVQESWWVWAFWGPVILASSWPGLLLSRRLGNRHGGS